mmetsp:Transcript_4292/g.6424  ORF Transcript_4292/g.6424 Transcript_4292/m.6424 type:complete len:217 (+) Transcript_4292:3301-3951(+)
MLLTSEWIQLVSRTDEASLGSRSNLLAAITIGLLPAICLRLGSREPCRSKRSIRHSTTASVLRIAPSSVSNRSGVSSSCCDQPGRRVCSTWPYCCRRKQRWHMHTKSSWKRSRRSRKEGVGSGMSAWTSAELVSWPVSSISFDGAKTWSARLVFFVFFRGPLAFLGAARDCTPSMTASRTLAACRISRAVSLSMSMPAISNILAASCLSRISCALL